MTARVLLVDDAATVRMYHRNILESAGFSVDEAVNGLEALEKLLLQPYDLYIVDVNMPVMDGYAFLRELRTRNVPQAPALMISTEAGAHDRTGGLHSGANAYFVKPARADALVLHARLLTGGVPA